MFLFPKLLTRQILVILFVNISLIGGKETTPDLSLLFSSIQNCDLHILISGWEMLDFPSQLYLPIVLSVFLTRRHKHYIDTAKVKPSSCRIIYSEDDFAIKYFLLPTLQSYKFQTVDGMQPIKSRANIFSIFFLKSAKIFQTLEFWIKLSGLESFGVLIIKLDSSLELCLAINAFKVVDTWPNSCTELGNNNILQIYQNLRQPPRKWFTTSNLGLSKDLLKSDLTSWKQPPNPMNRWSSIYSLHLHHIQAIFSRNNASLTFREPTYYTPDIVSDSFVYFGEEIIEDVYFGQIIIMTEITGYSFLTCFAEEKFSFKFYVTPFQLEVWVGVVAAYLSLVLFLVIYLFQKKSKNSFCPWLYSLGALLEDVIPAPKLLEGHTWFRIYLGSWILSAIFLTNCYNGLMITGLNSPLQSSSVKTFRDLVCDWQEIKYSFVEYRAMKNKSAHSHPNFAFDDYLSYVNGLFGFGNETVNPYLSRDCFSLLSVPAAAPDFTQHQFLLPQFFTFLYNLYFKYVQASLLKIDPSQVTEPIQKDYELEINLFHPNQRHFPEKNVNFSKLSYPEWVQRVEEEVVKCSKTVQVLPLKMLQSEMDYLARNYPTAKFHQSKEILQPKNLCLILRNSGSSRIPRDYKSLIETGIYGRLNTEFYARKSFRRKRAGEWKPIGVTLTMKSSLVTLFIISPGFCSLGLLVFCVEFCRGKVVVLVIRWCQRKPRKILERKKILYKNHVQRTKKIIVASVQNTVKIRRTDYINLF